MLQKYKYHLLLHFTILVWGFTGIIGKMLDISGLSSYEVVFWRMLIGWVALFVYLIFSKKKIVVNRKTMLKCVGNGILIALHW